MALSLSPSERSLRARMGAHALHARGGTNTGPATAAFLARFEREVDPDGVLPPAERTSRRTRPEGLLHRAGTQGISGPPPRGHHDLVTCCRACSDFGNRFTVAEPPPTSEAAFHDLRDRVFVERKAMILAKREQERAIYRKLPRPGRTDPTVGEDA